MHLDNGVHPTEKLNAQDVVEQSLPLKNKELTHVYSPLFLYSPTSSGIAVVGICNKQNQNLYAELFVPA